MDEMAAGEGSRVFYPPPALCTDNGAMIAFAGWQRLRAGQSEPLSFQPRARWRMEELPPV
jgi:N6-L-threonylcarbamoyladenine synthase